MLNPKSNSYSFNFFNRPQIQLVWIFELYISAILT
ncbi:hypothetical protein C5167_017222 [Papaver somniferum]|uniref:Uncharacterized protein n=1 Tax=Papaver somniferum TaxID=3469 RepID=A0A4Y7IIU0_PAPSO|nr:hypothetical protein C5167_017222 [Papaver somniferum]